MKFLFRRQRKEIELEEEIQSHLRMAERDRIQDGENHEQAKYSVRREFGNLDLVKETTREMWGGHWLSRLFQDLKYTLRIIRRNPGSTLTVVALLTLGMGVVTAVFNPIYSLVVAPLPFPEPDRLVRIGGNIPLFNTTHGEFENRELLNRTFSNLTAYGMEPDAIFKFRILETGKVVDTRSLVSVTEDFFETLGVRPVRGSVYGRNENGIEIIVSHRFWQKEFMGREDVIGKSISALGQPDSYAITGVMPETFDFPTGTDIWVSGGESASFTGIPSIQLVGRLRSGISERQAARDLEAIDFESYYGRYGSAGPTLQSLHAVIYGYRLPLLWMIGAVAVLFLLLVCAGVSNFLIAHGIRRRSEMTLRLILGAMRWKLIYQLLRETLPLVLTGGVAGLVIAKFVSIWLRKQFPVLEGDGVAIPVKIVFFSALVLAVTIVSGLIPALRASGGDLNTRLKSSFGSKRRFLSTQELLVGVQLSLTLALIFGAGALLRSLMDRVDFQIGWLSPQEIVIVTAEFPFIQSMVSREGKTRTSRFYFEAHRQFEAMPEVVSVGNLSPIPFSADAIRATQTSSRKVVLYKVPAGASNMEELEELRNKPSIACLQGIVSPTGFDVLGIPLIAGRTFNSTEIANHLEANIEGSVWPKSGPRVAIVNRTMAQNFWPGESAVGKTVYDGNRAIEIVGVVSDFHLDNNIDVAPAFYRPSTGAGLRQRFIIRLRSNASLASFRSNVRRQLSGLDTEARLEVRTFQEQASALKDHRLSLSLISCFALLGIVVSGLGVYAASTLMAYSRNKEIGIRMAAGAQYSHILRLILSRTARVLLIGLPCGLFLGWALTNGLSSVVFELKPNDPAVWIISCAALLVITTVAALVPALRAARINPAHVLRSE